MLFLTLLYWIIKTTYELKFKKTNEKVSMPGVPIYKSRIFGLIANALPIDLLYPTIGSNSVGNLSQRSRFRLPEWTLFHSVKKKKINSYKLVLPRVVTLHEITINFFHSPTNSAIINVRPVSIEPFLYSLKLQLNCGKDWGWIQTSHRTVKRKG